VFKSGGHAHLRSHHVHVSFRIEDATRIHIDNRISPRTPFRRKQTLEFFEITGPISGDSGAPGDPIEALKAWRKGLARAEEQKEA
jgi:hypothetical protein